MIERAASKTPLIGLVLMVSACQGSLQVDAHEEAQEADNGITANGLFQNGLFQNGLFQNGLFQNGLFQNGLFQNGLFQNGLDPAFDQVLMDPFLGKKAATFLKYSIACMLPPGQCQFIEYAVPCPRKSDPDELCTRQVAACGALGLAPEHFVSGGLTQQDLDDWATCLGMSVNRDGEHVKLSARNPALLPVPAASERAAFNLNEGAFGGRWDTTQTNPFHFFVCAGDDQLAARQVKRLCAGESDAGGQAQCGALFTSLGRCRPDPQDTAVAHAGCTSASEADLGYTSCTAFPNPGRVISTFVSRSLEGCYTEGLACDGTFGCCAGLVCGGDGTCQPPPPAPTCGNEGEPCGDGCCAGLVCSGGLCTTWDLIPAF